MKRVGMVVCIVMILLLVGISSGTILPVPEEYREIQRAIVSSSDGDTVSVRPGTPTQPAIYFE